MSACKPNVSQIRDAAESFVTMTLKYFGEEFGGYNETGVRWVAKYIQEKHDSGDTTLREEQTFMIGAFLGECIIRNFGGAWAESNGRWCVRFGEGTAAYPFTKVAKHFHNGAEDSVVGLYLCWADLFAQGVIVRGASDLPLTS
jgi:hypothetical protein